MRRNIFRGLIAIIPLALSAAAVYFLYTAIDRRVASLAAGIFHRRIPGLGFFLVVVFLYLLGLVASNIVGRQFLSLFEGVARRIPLVRTTYQVGKQVSAALAAPDKQVFKRVVLVEFLRPGMWTIGFVTGQLIDADRNNEIYLKVFVPTPPNPATGNFILVPENLTRDPGWTVEEALHAVVSGGIIGPDKVGHRGEQPPLA